jgi:hypothetical protein
VRHEGDVEFVATNRAPLTTHDGACPARCLRHHRVPDQSAECPVLSEQQPTARGRTSDCDPEGQARVRAFHQAMNDLGWADGRNVRIDVRWAAGDADRFRSHAAELVDLGPDVIAANSNIAVTAVSAGDRHDLDCILCRRRSN